MPCHRTGCHTFGGLFAFLVNGVSVYTDGLNTYALERGSERRSMMLEKVYISYVARTASFEAMNDPEISPGTSPMLVFCCRRAPFPATEADALTA
eukprot:654888-Rhodomonas_salina.3